MTSTFRPAAASAAAMLTVVVVLPTPPFWLETVKTRVFSGLGSCLPSSRSRRLFSCASSRAMGLESSMESSTLLVCGREVSRETLGHAGRLCNRSRVISGVVMSYWQEP